MEKTVILNQNRDFQLLYQRGKKIASPYVIIYLRKTRRKYNRLGITVGKKVGCAVKRSRARRVIRQAYRETGTPDAGGNGHGHCGVALYCGHSLHTTA